VTPITAAKKEAPAAAAAPPKDVKKAPPMGQGAVDESIRVSLSRVEKLLNFVGEMVILQAVLREQAADSNSHLLKRTVHQLGKVTKEVQDMSMSLRMVPLKPTFQKMQRIVRDTAGALGKTVQLILVGEDTELDKTVLERINDPLVHLVRNSVDHGVENADVRRSRGKTPDGHVTLSAYHQSGKLVIEVKDDGGGLDPEKLKNIATQKGILKPGAVLTEKEAYNLIFAPGFSTKAEVTDISGRGVGMDVVRTNIQELNGEIQIESEIGKGTTFKIFLPLTLAIIDGMVIKLGDERFVIPLSHVHESVKPNIEDIKFTTGMGEVFMLRGENLPMYRLSHLLGRKSTLESHEMIAVVVRTGEIPFAILIDDIIGQYQVVIKQLGPEVQGIRGISGSTILGDGRPALILEPVDLVKRDRKSPAPRPTEARRAV
jgi:two-component system chemotaxis sensor kinase CheA